MSEQIRYGGLLNKTCGDCVNCVDVGLPAEKGTDKSKYLCRLQSANQERSKWPEINRKDKACPFFKDINDTTNGESATIIPPLKKDNNTIPAINELDAREQFREIATDLDKISQKAIPDGKATPIEPTRRPEPKHRPMKVGDMIRIEFNQTFRVTGMGKALVCCEDVRGKESAFPVNEFIFKVDEFRP